MDLGKYSYLYSRIYILYICEVLKYKFVLYKILLCVIKNIENNNLKEDVIIFWAIALK